MRNMKAKYRKQSEPINNGHGRRWKEIIIDQRGLSANQEEEQNDGS